jgi:hypothetical protein
VGLVPGYRRRSNVLLYFTEADMPMLRERRFAGGGDDDGGDDTAMTSKPAATVQHDGFYRANQASSPNRSTGSERLCWWSRSA